jgi:hypothetical protein
VAQALAALKVRASGDDDERRCVPDFLMFVPPSRRSADLQ